MQSDSAHSHLIKRSRQEAVFLSSSMIDRSVEAALASIEQAERRASSVALRLQLAEALAGIAKHRASMRSGYANVVDEAIGEALRASGTQVALPGRPVPENEFEFTLMEDEAVTRFVEASRLQQTAMPLVEHELARLDSLMSSALGLPVVRADLNPLRPDVMCGALLKLVDGLPESPEVHAHWVRHMAPAFARELKRLYESIANDLEQQGVEEARYRVKLTESGPLLSGAESGEKGPGGKGRGSGGGGGQGGHGIPDGAVSPAQRRKLFPRMNDLAQAQPAVSQALMRDFLYRPQWVADHDEPLPAAYYEAVQQQSMQVASQPVDAYDEAAQARLRARDRALAAVDRPARTVDVGTALSPEQWGAQASPAERTRTMMALKGQAKKISQALGLDAVRTLVGQVAGDERVLAPVREAFVAMEPALLRMAMADPRFFGDDHHPARRLVEEVAQRSFKYNDEFSDEFEEFMAPVRGAVRDLNERTQASAKSFADKLQGLASGWRTEDESEGEAQKDGLHSMHFAQERQALADKVAWEFSLRSDLDGVPVVVADFLFRDWSLVIAHAQLTDARGQLDPGGYLAVVTDLLWSVKRQATLKNPARLFEVLPYLLSTLRRGLHMLGKDPAESEAFFNALMRYHDPVLRLRRVRSARDAGSSAMAPLEFDSNPLPLESEAVPLERPQPRAAEQPWLGRHEQAAAGFEDGIDTGAAPLELPSTSGHSPLAGAVPAQPPVSTSGLALLDTAPAPPVSQVPAPANAAPAQAAATTAVAAALPRGDESDEDRQARLRSVLERLRKGDWVDLRIHGQWRRAQLSWVSDNGSLFMFVSKGGRPHSMTRRTCEKLLRNRHLRPVDASAVVDKALRRLADAPAPARPTDFLPMAA
ncbi:MAG: DUF1631 family protein [Pseudomonadota bacterium]|nr:DUF1631 family protein [Pseudomonadota bacterium]